MRSALAALLDQIGPTRFALGATLIGLSAWAPIAAGGPVDVRVPIGETGGVLGRSGAPTPQ